MSPARYRYMVAEAVQPRKLWFGRSYAKEVKHKPGRVNKIGGLKGFGLPKNPGSIVLIFLSGLGSVCLSRCQVPAALVQEGECGTLPQDSRCLLELLVRIAGPRIPKQISQ